MENMALLLSEGKPVAAAKVWFARATQMQTQAQMNMQCCLHFQRTQGQHIRMRSPSPFS